MHTFDNKAKGQRMWPYGAESPCVEERASQIMLSTHGRPFPDEVVRLPFTALCPRQGGTGLVLFLGRTCEFD